MKLAIGAVINRSRTVMVAFLVIVGAGIVSYNALPKLAEPEVAFPLVFVQLFLEGVSPEDAETLLIRPMEQELRSLDGLKKMEAIANENSATINLEFEPDVDITKVIQDVRESVDLARAKLPSDAEEPRVQEANMARFQPMLVMNLGGQVPDRTLYAISRSLQEQIEGVDGVLEANIVGIREELLEITIDPLAMDSYGLSPADVLGFVERNNRMVAAGSMQSEQGRFAIKVPGIIESPEDILNVPVKVDNGRVVHFRDIALVRRTFKDTESYARLNQKPALAIEVIKRGGVNLLTTVADVKELVAKIEPTWPPGVELTFSSDKSIHVKNSIANLVNNVTAAILLVFIVLLAILGLQNAVLVGIAIPGSFCAAFFLLNIFGMTINTVVLFGLIMSVGLLVDGSIVVTELADRRMAEGIHRKRAYAGAAQRMAWPIISSTGTTLAAFLPLVFWPGQLGQFMKSMPLTLIFTLTASLVMALLVVPTFGTIMGKPGRMNERQHKDIVSAESGDLMSIGGYTGSYIHLMNRALKYPGLVVLGLFTLLTSIYISYGLFGAGVEMWPDADPDGGVVLIHARGDLSVLEQDQLVRLVEEKIYGINDIENYYVRSGTTNAGATDDVIGSITLNYHDWRMRRPSSEIVAEIRERTADIAGLVLETREVSHFEGTEKPVDIVVSGISRDSTNTAVVLVREAMEKMPGIINIQDSRPLPSIEWRLEVDRAQAAKFGADVSVVGSIIQLVTTGIRLGNYRPDDAVDEIDIRVRFPADQRSLDSLGELRIPTQAGSVPISTFVKRRAAESTKSITRINRRRTLSIHADLAEGFLIGPTLDVLELQFPDLNLPADVRVEFKGGAEQQAESTSFMFMGFGLAMALMAMILLTQFNSVFQTFLILTAVIFSTGGVLLGLIVTQQPFGLVSCGIGAIALAGIVVNNNIVLIDTYNQLRDTGMERKEVILRTCAQRMRPVMLTTITTVLGLMPMALALNLDILNRDAYFGGPSAAFWKQMSTVVCGGLIFATILTLVLTPSFLMLQSNLSARLRDKRLKERASRAGKSQAAVS
jgi:multidrug efflux pump